MKTNLDFYVSRNESNARNNHYTIEAKYDERFNCFRITYKMGKNVDFNTVAQTIEDVKCDVTRRINDGYLKRDINYTYRY